MTRLSMDAPAKIVHPAHQHELKLAQPGGDAPFQCNGCMEPGGGARYTCACVPGCSFHLHMDCALAKPTLVHPLLKRSSFQLCQEPPEPRRSCDACGGDVHGFHYHCAATEKNLHPCCASLQVVVEQAELRLLLRKRKGPFHRCKRCGEAGGRFFLYWYYRSACRTVYLHVACVKKEMATQKWAAAGGGGTSSGQPPFIGEVGGGGSSGQAPVVQETAPLQKNQNRRTSVKSGSATAPATSMAKEIAGEVVANVVTEYIQNGLNDLLARGGGDGDDDDGSGGDDEDDDYGDHDGHSIGYPQT